MIEKHIGYARIRLIHPDYIAARWKLASGRLVFLLVGFLLGFRSVGASSVSGFGSRFGRLLLRLRLLLYGKGDREGRRGSRDLAALLLKNPQQLRLGPRSRVITGKYICGRTGGLRLLDRSLALQIEVLQKELGIRPEVVECD